MHPWAAVALHQHAALHIRARVNKAPMRWQAPLIVQIAFERTRASLATARCSLAWLHRLYVSIVVVLVTRLLPAPPDDPCGIALCEIVVHSPGQLHSTANPMVNSMADLKASTADLTAPPRPYAGLSHGNAHFSAWPHDSTSSIRPGDSTANIRPGESALGVRPGGSAPDIRSSSSTFSIGLGSPAFNIRSSSLLTSFSGWSFT